MLSKTIFLLALTWSYQAQCWELSGSEESEYSATLDYPAMDPTEKTEEEKVELKINSIESYVSGVGESIGIMELMLTNLQDAEEEGATTVRLPDSLRTPAISDVETEEMYDVIEDYIENTQDMLEDAQSRLRQLMEDLENDIISTADDNDPRNEVMKMYISIYKTSETQERTLQKLDNELEEMRNGEEETAEETLFDAMDADDENLSEKKSFPNDEDVRGYADGSVADKTEENLAPFENNLYNNLLRLNNNYSALSLDAMDLTSIDTQNRSEEYSEDDYPADEYYSNNLMGDRTFEDQDGDLTYPRDDEADEDYIAPIDYMDLNYPEIKNDTLGVNEHEVLTTEETSIAKSFKNHGDPFVSVETAGVNEVKQLNHSVNGDSGDSDRGSVVLSQAEGIVDVPDTANKGSDGDAIFPPAIDQNSGIYDTYGGFDVPQSPADTTNDSSEINELYSLLLGQENIQGQSNLFKGEFLNYYNENTLEDPFATLPADQNEQQQQVEETVGYDLPVMNNSLNELGWFPDFTSQNRLPISTDLDDNYQRNTIKDQQENGGIEAVWPEDGEASQLYPAERADNAINNDQTPDLNQDIIEDRSETSLEEQFKFDNFESKENQRHQLDSPVKDTFIPRSDGDFYSWHGEAIPTDVIDTVEADQVEFGVPPDTRYPEVESYPDSDKENIRNALIFTICCLSALVLLVFVVCLAFKRRGSAMNIRLLREDVPYTTMEAAMEGEKARSKLGSQKMYNINV